MRMSIIGAVSGVLGAVMLGWYLASAAPESSSTVESVDDELSGGRVLPSRAVKPVVGTPTAVQETPESVGDHDDGASDEPPTYPGELTGRPRERMMARAVLEISKCYNDYIDTVDEDATEGRVTVRVVIEPGEPYGVLGEVSIKNVELDDYSLRECVMDAFIVQPLPSPMGGPALIEQTFVFRVAEEPEEPEAEEDEV